MSNKRVETCNTNLTFNSYEWLRQNFSLKYLYTINQISDKNKEKDQFGDN